MIPLTCKSEGTIVKTHYFKERGNSFSEVAEIEDLIQEQNRWREKCINLIASENVMSRRSRSQAGSDFAHPYAEGHLGERYYRGTSYIDEFIKECIMEKRPVKEEVNRFRPGYQEVKYSFDELVRRKPELVEVKAT